MAWHVSAAYCHTSEYLQVAIGVTVCVATACDISVRSRGRGDPVNKPHAACRAAIPGVTFENNGTNEHNSQPKTIPASGLNRKVQLLRRKSVDPDRHVGAADRLIIWRLFKTIDTL